MSEKTFKILFDFGMKISQINNLLVKDKVS